MELGMWGLSVFVVVTIAAAVIRHLKAGKRTFSGIIGEEDIIRAQTALQAMYKQYELDGQAGLAQLTDHSAQLPRTVMPSDMLSYDNLAAALSAIVGVVHEGDIDEVLRYDDASAFPQLEVWYRQSMLPVWVGQLMNRAGIFTGAPYARNLFRSEYNARLEENRVTQ